MFILGMVVGCHGRAIAGSPDPPGNRRPPHPRPAPSLERPAQHVGRPLSPVRPPSPSGINKSI